MKQVAIDPKEFRRVLASYPTGVSVVTALGADGAPVGMALGSFTSVSLDPPLVGFMPDKRSTSWPKILAAGRFCINVLASDQLQVCRRLALSGPDKFRDVEYSLSALGFPVLAGATTVVECELASVTEAGDHWFVLGRVLDLAVVRDAEPMLFFNGRYGTFIDCG